MDGKERSRSHPMEVGGFEMKTQKINELHPCCRAQELIEDRIVRVCWYYLV